MPKINVRANLRKGLEVEVEARKNSLMTDATQKDGGKDAHLSPKEMFLGSVASCKVMTVELYAERKGWKVENISIEMEFNPLFGKENVIYQRVTIVADLSDDKIQKLKEIAELCPVGQYMKQGVSFENL